MKKIPCIIATAVLAGAVVASASSSAEAASFNPVLAQPTSTFPFTDVPVGSKEMVSALYQNKFFNGVSTGEFGWNQTIKRVDAAMIAARGMGFRKDDLMRGEESVFKDIPDRAKDAIFYLKHYGVVNGKTETIFGSNDMITRGEAAIILSRVYSSVLLRPTEPVHHFIDAAGRYAGAINSLAATGIVNGKTPDLFGTDDPIKRGEFAIMVARLSDPALSPSSDSNLPSPPGGITMKADTESYSLSSDTGVSLTIVNKEDFPYGYRYQYTLEKKQEDKWLEIKENYGILYPTDVPQIEAGETMKVNVSFDRFRTLITAGEYRIKNTFGVAEFTITE